MRGERTGEGTSTFKNTRRYEGSFVNGERKGKGRLTTSKGDCYIGEFRSGGLQVRRNKHAY